MADDLDKLIRRCVMIYRSGAWCESIFYGVLIELSERCSPERFLAGLPQDIRDQLEYTIRDRPGWEHLEPEMVASPGFQGIYAWLTAQRGELPPQAITE